MRAITKQRPAAPPPVDGLAAQVSPVRLRRRPSMVIWSVALVLLGGLLGLAIWSLRSAEALSLQGFESFSFAHILQDARSSDVWHLSGQFQGFDPLNTSAMSPGVNSTPPVVRLVAFARGTRTRRQTRQGLST